MPDLNDDGDFAQANDRDDRNDNSASSPPILHRTTAEPSPTLSNNISDAFSDAEDSGVSSQQKASPTVSARPTADNSFSSSISTSPRSHHSDTWDSVDTGLVSVCSQSGSNRKSDGFDSNSTSLQAPERKGKKHLHQPSGELSPTCDSFASKQWSTSPKGSTRSHSDHLSSTISGGVECKNHRPTIQSSPVRSGRRRKSNSSDVKADRYPKRVRRTCHEPSDSANNHNTVLAEDHDKSELELPPPDLDLFDDDCMIKTSLMRDNEAKAGIKSSPRLKYLPCVEDISDPESDGEKDVPGKFHNSDSDMPVLFSQRSRPQANKVKGDAEKDLDGSLDFAVPTPPPKYEPENVLEEAVQFDSEMSQSSCSTPSYPIVSPLTLGESCKVDRKDSDHKSVDAEEIDFAESFLNGAQTLSAEIEEQIRKQQQQQIQLEKQGQSAKRTQELLPSVDITPFAPDFQDMDYVYDLGLMSMTPTPNGTVYGSLNPAVINNKHVQNQDCSSSQAEFSAGKGKGSNRGDKKASDSKRRAAKSRSKKHLAGDKRVTSASPARVDNEMDKLLSQQSVGFELLDDFDETPFSSGGRAVSAQLDDLFEPSIMDNMNSSQGMDFTFTQSDGHSLIAAPSCDIGSDMVLQCVDIVEETKMIIHRQGGGNTPRHAGHGLDMQSLSGHGSSHDVSMGTSTMGIHTCDCGAQFSDQWSYQEHEVFCNGPQLFNCGL
ncbi:hypothetical protein LSH36_193g07036 [Paralvinella palmiformis]|uniref:Uncharacterized protein n=1 Tax=Paralvinella palmiformis TaxID=53620 RepID=A0AAD9JRM3_9ANNE|nr:hypothetical protein LSH36_193g07036 [Paralvinella palmiformis]